MSPLSIRRWRLPALVWLAAFVVYGSVCLGVLGREAFAPVRDDHYAHLAASWLAGQLHVLGDAPPGFNDWGCFDLQQRVGCPADMLGRPNPDPQRYRWYVTFPPVPALAILPWVALAGPQLPSRWLWIGLAALGPALLFALLRRLREAQESERRQRDDLLLAALFAVGSVYFFTSVFVSHQGSVFYSAHVVACVLSVLFLGWSWQLRRPAWAGAALGLLFFTRPTTLFLGTFVAWQLWHDPRPWRQRFKVVAALSAPLLAIALLGMALNQARFGNPLEFGHRYLIMPWTDRVERWGLFNYHYVAKNLAIMTSSLPWLSRVPPHLTISGHGLALWVTTPNLLWVLWPKRRTPHMRALAWAIVPIILANLMYQNSGWLQFGYRFSLDYMVPLMVLLALGGRRFGKAFLAAAIVAVVVNTFGAITFDRTGRFYHVDASQTVLFQPD